jgi:hypothetical protein
VWTYARGFAHANYRRPERARADRAKLAALEHADFSRFEPFGVPAVPMTKLSLALLDGEIARLSGDLPGAVAKFRAAAELEAALPYTEPPYWHQPVSHLLGAALLQAKQPAEAEAVYRKSLHTYRDDGWALFGWPRRSRPRARTPRRPRRRPNSRRPGGWPTRSSKAHACRRASLNIVHLPQDHWGDDHAAGQGQRDHARI